MRQLIVGAVSLVLGLTSTIFIVHYIRSTKTPPVPASSAPELPKHSSPGSLQDVSNTMKESMVIMGEAGEVMHDTSERLRKMMLTEVTAYPIKGKTEQKLRELCFRQNGEPKWRGGWGPFICWSREPDCDKYGCMEGGPSFIVYQVPEGALY